MIKFILINYICIVCGMCLATIFDIILNMSNGNEPSIFRYYSEMRFTPRRLLNDHNWLYSVCVIVSTLSVLINPVFSLAGTLAQSHKRY